jgi:histidine triad (HIT) family protein
MTTDQECIFCKIISGTIPSFQIYSDDKVVAFLDIFPASKGKIQHKDIKNI